VGRQCSRTRRFDSAASKVPTAEEDVSGKSPGACRVCVSETRSDRCRLHHRAVVGCRGVLFSHRGGSNTRSAGRVTFGARRSTVERLLPEFDRLDGRIEWVGVNSVERNVTLQCAVRLGVRLHPVELSLSNTEQPLEMLGVARSHTAVHDRVRTAGLQPDGDVDPDRIAGEKTLIHVNGRRHWLFAAVDPDANSILHARPFQTRTTQLTVLVLRDRREKQQVSDAASPVDDASRLTNAPARLGLRPRVCRHGDPNGVERVLRDIRHRTVPFPDILRRAGVDRRSRRTPSASPPSSVLTAGDDSPDTACFATGTRRPPNRETGGTHPSALPLTFVKTLD